MDEERYRRAKNRLVNIKQVINNLSDKKLFRRDDFSANFIPERLNLDNRLNFVALK